MYSAFALNIKIYIFAIRVQAFSEALAKGSDLLKIITVGLIFRMTQNCTDFLFLTEVPKAVLTTDILLA